MEQREYKIIKEAFLSSYKSFVDFVNLTHNEYSMYSILVTKIPTSNNSVKVNITIRNSHNGDNMLNEYTNNVVLPKDIADQLIVDIREDFKNKHIIIYSTVNPRALVQTLQNTKFSLNIKLNTLQDYDEALEFNYKINSNERKKVLTRN